MELRLLPCGERAVLVEVSDLDAVLALHAAVTARIAQEGATQALRTIPAIRNNAKNLTDFISRLLLILCRGPKSCRMDTLHVIRIQVATFTSFSSPIPAGAQEAH